MNNNKLKKYVETKIALYQYEERISGKDFYDMGVSILKQGKDTSSNIKYYDEGFDCGKCQGELDALMMVYALMDKGE